jgi:hypothetical protein
MANGMFSKNMDIDRHGPRLMPNNCHIVDPHYFSLPTTFKVFEGGYWKDFKNYIVISKEQAKT